MGDDIEFKTAEVIQNGLLQMDFWNNTKHEGYRCFVDPIVFFAKIGASMQKNHGAYVKAYIAQEQAGGESDT